MPYARVHVERPRVRSADGSGEVRLATYEHFADRDVLSRVVMERMLASVLTRRYARIAEPAVSGIELPSKRPDSDAVQPGLDSAFEAETTSAPVEHRVEQLSRS